jgi:hypothetical protein
MQIERQRQDRLLAVETLHDRANSVLQTAVVVLDLSREKLFGQFTPKRVCVIAKTHSANSPFGRSDE